MFTKLYRILLLTVVIIFIFFVISTLSFSDRLAEGKPAWVEDRVQSFTDRDQTTPPNLGECDGGSWMATLPSCISLHSQPSHTYGVQRLIIED
jgi:hypothetical protein